MSVVSGANACSASCSALSRYACKRFRRSSNWCRMIGSVGGGGGEDDGSAARASHSFRLCSNVVNSSVHSADMRIPPADQDDILSAGGKYDTISFPWPVSDASLKYHASRRFCEA